MTHSDKPRVVVDGLVFENNHQMGIWRIFHEVMSRNATRLDYTLWLRNPRIQPVPPMARLIRDSGRRCRPRWDVVSLARRYFSQRVLPAGVRQADVFHSTYFTPCPVSCPGVVVSVYDMIAERAYSVSGGEGWELNIRAKREAILSATLCVAISESTAQDLKLFYPQVTDRIRVVQLGADHLPSDNLSGRQSKANPPYALYVGHRHGYKNFHTVIEALRTRSWPRDLILHVVGSPLAWFEERLLAAYGLEGRVRSLGRLPDAELRAQYAAARCFIYPSLLEGFGLPVLEAHANGCPAVLSDIPAFREVAGDAAVFFDPRLGERLAEAVAAAREPDVRRRLVEGGYENVRRFSWDQAARQTLAVYEEAIRLKGQ
jgi:glycosyltransferase involved in cell wall biosynthesis